MSRGLGDVYKRQPREWCVHPSARLLEELAKLPGINRAVCEYNAAGARLH